MAKSTKRFIRNSIFAGLIIAFTIVGVGYAGITAALMTDNIPENIQTIQP